MKLYGISNCDTVKKTRTWLVNRGYDVPFHDFKKDGISAALLKHWFIRENWAILLNRQGTTWRQLPDEVKHRITTEAPAMELMLEKPSIIKRPVLELNNKVHVGFDAENYASLFPLK